MGLNTNFLSGQTPLDEDERDGLLIPTISIRSELDEFEQHNIEEALLWLVPHKLDPGTIFSESFICTVHRRMYGLVWKWAGEFRTTNKNIGVDKWQIGIELKKLLDDGLFWVEHKSFPADELAIRFKHRLVSIHCFPNGNGRHSRLIADLIAEKLYQRPVFSWGSANLSNSGNSRANYLTALRLADQGNYSPLIAFARS